MKKNYFLLLLFFIPFINYSQDVGLGSCPGNLGDPIFTEDFGTGTLSEPLPAGVTDYQHVTFSPGESQYILSENTHLKNGWQDSDDHTPNDTDGRCMIINSDTDPDEEIYYSVTATGLCESTSYEFSAWLLNLINPDLTVCVDGGVRPKIRFEIWDSTDTTLLASGETVEGQDLEPSTTPNWERFALVFQTVAGQSSVIMKIKNIQTNTNNCGNDLAIDDISFASCGDLTEVTNDTGETSMDMCFSDLPDDLNLIATPDFAVYNEHVYQWQIGYDLDGDHIPEDYAWGDIPDENNNSITYPVTEDILDPATNRIYFRAKVAEFLTNIDNENCNSYSTVFELRVNENPDAPMSNGDVVFDCVNGNSTISVTSASGIEINWYDDSIAGNILQLNGATYIANAPGTYYAEAYNPITGCTSETRTPVQVTGDLPDAPISDGDVAFNCDTNSAMLSVNVPAGVQVDWYDAPANGNLLQANSETYTATAPGTYYAEAIITATGCSSATRTAVSAILNAPNPITGLENLQKCGTETPGYTFDLTQNTAAALGSQNAADFTVTYYETQADANTPQNEIQTPENYQSQNNLQTIYVRVESTISIGCYETGSFTIQSMQNETIVVEESLSACPNTNVDLTQVIDGLQIDSNNYTIAGYYLSEADAQNDSNAINNPEEFTISTDNQTVYLKVESATDNSCYTLYALQIEPDSCGIEIPKGFSPNGDGINDRFVIPNLAETYPKFNLKIYSRYGIKVYEGNEETLPWDGTSEKGNKLPTGTYFYVLDLNSPDTKVIEDWVYVNK